MVLSQDEIRAEVESGNIVFTPELEENQYGPTNVDLRLDFQISVLREAPGVSICIAEGLKSLGDFNPWETHDIPEFDEFHNRRKFPVKKNQFILARTLEIVKIPSHLIGMVEGRSSYARFGLSVHETAPWIHPGYNNRITLEIMNSGPLTLDLVPKTDRPCQLTFLRMSEVVKDTDLYKGQFQGPEN